MSDSDDSIPFPDLDALRGDNPDDTYHERKFLEQEYYRKVEMRAKTKKYLRDLRGEDEEEEEKEPKDEYADEGEEFWLTMDMLISMYDNFPKNQKVYGSRKCLLGWCHMCGKFKTEDSCEHYGIEVKLNEICGSFWYASGFGKSEASTVAWKLKKLRDLHDSPIKSNLTEKMIENIEKEKLGIGKANGCGVVVRHMSLYKAIRFFEMMPSTDVDVEMRKLNDFKHVSAAIKKIAKDTENEEKILEVISNVNKEINKAKRTKGSLKRKPTSSSTDGSKKKKP